LNDLVAAEVELERMVGQRLRPNYPPERPILPGDIREQAEEAAIELRHRLGVGLSPIVDIVSLLELELGMRVFIRPLWSGSISGLFVYDDELGACVLLNRNHSRRRRALTAAHELGHLVSARSEPDIVDLAHDPTSREERFAKAFSLAFMMPAAAVRRRFHEILREAGRFSPRHLVLLAHAHNVSEEAMCRRLEELQLLPGGTWESLKERKFSAEEMRRSLGDQTNGPEPIVSPRLWLLAGEAYRRELLSEGQLARMLRMERVEVRAMLDTLDAEGTHDLRSVSAN
jgi:Zn-dependent peptidase ImmA (M78 family)